MRRLRKFIFIVVVLLSITALGIYYVNTIFLPLQVKSLIIKKAKAYLKRDVSIDELLFSPVQGIILKNIRVEQNNGDPIALINIAEITMAVPLPDFFWTGRVFVPAVTLRNPTLYLKCNAQNEWNFSDLLPPKENRSPASALKNKNPRFSIGTVNIIEGHMTISDPQRSETINMINVTTHADILKKVNFELSFAILRHSTTGHAAGHFSLSDKELTADIKVKNADIPPLVKLLKVPLWIDLKECFMKHAALSFHYKNAETTLAGKIAGDVDFTTTKTSTPVNLKTTITSQDFLLYHKRNHFTFKGGFLSNNSALSVGHDKTFNGNFKGNTIVIERNGDQFDLSGNLSGQNTSISFAGLNLSGDPQVENILYYQRGKNFTLSGQAKITNAVIKNTALDLKAALALAVFDLKKQDADFKMKIPNLSLNGSNGLFANTSISGDIKAQNILINATNGILQTDGKIKTQNLRLATAKNITLLGKPDFDLTITRNSNLPTEEGLYNFNGTITLNNDRLLGIPQYDEFTDMKGVISFNNDLVETEGIETNFKGSAWKISGKFINFQEPSVKISARSKTIDLTIIKDLLNKNLKNMGARIAGTAEDVLIQFEGLIFSKTASKISASGVLKSAEISSDNIPQKVSNMTGRVEYASNSLKWQDLNFTYFNKKYISSGLLTDFTNPAFEITLAGENFMVTGDGRFTGRIISLQSLKGEYYRSPFDLKGTISFRGEIPELKFNGKIFNGTTQVDSRVSPDQTKLSDMTFEIVNLDLEKLKNSIPAIKDKDIAGNLSLNAKLQGPLPDPGNWQGTGSFSVRDGRLLEMELLKGIWKTLFSNLVIDEYKYIAFTQANANFKIEDGRVSTNDFLLKSAAVDLSMKGRIEFNGKINLDVIADVRQAPLVTMKAVKAVPSTVISQFAKNVVGFKITGSLSEPQIKYKVLPLKVLKKTGDSVFLGIQGMMEDLLQ